MRTTSNIPRWLLLAGTMSAAALLVILAVFLAVEKRETPGAPDYRVVRLGGMEYERMDGRPIDPANAVDRQIVAGLPAHDRRLPRGQLLFGAFIAFTNASSRPLMSADRIELRDQGGRVYRPISLPRSNPYAYFPRRLPPRMRVPGFGSAADANLAATGRLLLFRVPARKYDDGAAFELVIHDPHAPSRTVSLIV